jgi:hypothetical protein
MQAPRRDSGTACPVHAVAARAHDLQQVLDLGGGEHVEDDHSAAVEDGQLLRLLLLLSGCLLPTGTKTPLFLNCIRQERHVTLRLPAVEDWVLDSIPYSVKKHPQRVTGC